jgi:hypothetical protein
MVAQIACGRWPISPRCRLICIQSRRAPSLLSREMCSAAPEGLRTGTHSAILYSRSGGMQCGSCHDTSVGDDQSAGRRQPPGVFVFSSVGGDGGARISRVSLVSWGRRRWSLFGYLSSPTALHSPWRFPRPQNLPYFSARLRPCPASVCGGCDERHSLPSPTASPTGHRSHTSSADDITHRGRSDGSRMRCVRNTRAVAKYGGSASSRAHAPDGQCRWMASA